jgi:hypothetical protein
MVHRPRSARGEQLHDLLDQEAALVTASQAVELVQQGVGDLERDHPDDLGARDGQRR